ncbi:hypothetical protein PHYSODRAFT_390171, partial [Phytophthora sojae]
MPFYFHCIRPNAKKQSSVTTKDLILQQCRSQRLTQQVQICLASSDESLSVWLSDLLHCDDCQTPKISVVASSVVQFNSISLVEKLELLLEDHEAEAATKIQSLFLMVMWRHRYLAKKRERGGLSNELLAWYGSEKTDTVKKLLMKYNGREDELRAKLELKKRAKFQAENAVHQLATDLKSLCLGNHGGLDAQAKVVLALRDMSLNPDVLEAQLADLELRAFYQKLWATYHDALVEVGEDPELLLFHSEDVDFVGALERFLTALAVEKQ